MCACAPDLSFYICCVQPEQGQQTNGNQCHACVVQGRHSLFCPNMVESPCGSKVCTNPLGIPSAKPGDMLEAAVL